MKQTINLNREENYYENKQKNISNYNDGMYNSYFANYVCIYEENV